jgi:hypothetical protein
MLFAKLLMKARKRVMAKGKKTPIRAGLSAGSSLLPKVEDGMDAVVHGHRDYFDKKIRGAFSDSLELDEAVRVGNENENRWDYLLGHHEKNEIIAVEPHSAKEDQITKVIRKKQMALQQIDGELRVGVKIKKWLWVASGNVQFLSMEKASYKLSQNGITFVGRTVKERDIS